MKGAHDVQSGRSEVHVSLNRVGITGITKIISIGSEGQENLFYSDLDLYVDLEPAQAGVHMSRFAEGLIAAVDDVVRQRALDIESFLQGLADSVLERQKARRAEVQVRARYPVEKRTPVSQTPTQEIYTLQGLAVGRENRTRVLVGVEASGLTVCPCAQELVRAFSREQLEELDLSDHQLDRVLETVPLASHNQRGRGTLLLGSDRKVPAEDLVQVVEQSMSSPVFDLLKRPDEFQVVRQAHLHPRFVEDVVREMVQKVAHRYSDLEDGCFVVARQVNYEGIHRYDVFAEKYGTLGEIRKEVFQGEHVTHPTTLYEWLDPGD